MRMLPATPLLDDFNRSDRLLDGPWIPELWAPNETMPTIVSGKAKSFGSHWKSAYWPTIFSGDAEVWFTYSDITNDPDGGQYVWLHATPRSGTYPYGYNLNPYAGHCGINKTAVSGNAAVEDVVISDPLPGEKFGLRTFGDRVQAWRKPLDGPWSPLSNGVVDTTHRSGVIGFEVDSGAAGSIDDFGGGEVPPISVLGADPRGFRKRTRRSS